MSVSEWVITLALLAVVVVVVARSVIELNYTRRIYDVLAASRSKLGMVSVLMTPAERIVVAELIEQRSLFTMQPLDMPAHECPTWVLVARTDGVSTR